MKKFTTLFTTVLLTMGLMLVTSPTMADPKVKEPKGNPSDQPKNNASDEVIACIALLETFPEFFRNFGQCVQTLKSGKDPKLPK